jgi:methylmalonyl-CoA/ethylmalonyl-CoA epimerase
MKLDHIGIAVRSLEASLPLYRDALRLEFVDEKTILAEQVRVAMLSLGETRIELLEATDPDSPIAKFIAKRGEGIHHIALAVEELDSQLARLQARGVRVLPGKAAHGSSGHRYAFLHPSDCGGVLVELVEAKKGDR